MKQFGATPILRERLVARGGVRRSRSTEAKPSGSQGGVCTILEPLVATSSEALGLGEQAAVTTGATMCGVHLAAWSGRRSAP